MNYDVIALACEQLDYRDKLRLAQLLIQTARKEEENSHPQKRADTPAKKAPQIIVEEIDTITYVVERLSKLKPVKVKSLTNSINSMFQFQGGIADSDVDSIIKELQKKKHIKIENNNVSYV
jgi:hypothetical protein